MAWLLEALALTVFTVLFFLAVVAVLWCCCRMYPIARRKGLRPTGAMVLIMAAAMGGAAAAVVAVGVLPTEQWSEPAENAAVLATVLLAPPASAALAAAVAPRRRNRAGGPRSIPFLFSSAARRLEVACRWFAISLIAVAVTTPFWLSWDLGLRLVVLAGSLFGVQAILDHFRERSSAPTLERTVRSDPRPPVLYLRPFAREADAFTWLPKEQLAPYTSIPMPSNSWVWFWKVSVEQYLSGALAGTIGPVLALGNPLDVLPPEGAARTYAEDEKDGDEGWKRQFRELAAASAALLMTAAWSDELRWELREVRRCGWHTKLFIVTPPASETRRLAERLIGTLVESARGVPRRPWAATAGQLRDTGYAVAPAPPPAGSVLAFDDGGTATLLARGVRLPEEYAAAIRRHLAGEAAGSAT